MSRSLALAAPGVLLLAACGLLADALAGGEVIELPPSLLLMAAAGYAAGAWGAPRISGPAVLLAACALTAASQLVSPDAYPVLDDLVFFLVAVGGPALAGAAVAGRARQVRELRRLAARIAEQREAEVRTAQAEERTRVEVGVHRRFSEDLAAIVMRAESARDVPDDDVRRALADIERTARSSLDRLREALGTLRDAEPQPERTAPTPARQAPEVTTPPSVVDAPRPAMKPADLAVGAVCAVALAVETVVSSAVRGPVWAGVLVAAVVGVFVALLRTRTLVAAGGVLTALTAMALWLTPPTELVSTLLPLSVVGYAWGARTTGAARWVGCGVLAAWLVVLVQAGPPGGDGDGVLPLLIWMGLAVLAGVITSGWEARTRQLQASVSELERGRDVELQLAVAEQRGRLAHDLHDTVAHALTVVCLQASAGQVDAEAGAAAAREVVLRSARTGLEELREGLDGLGDAQALAAEELAGQARRAGVHPEVSVTGAVDTLPASVRLLAARVSREALVNAGRYAPGSQVAVSVDVADVVRVEISDSGGVGSSWAHGAGTGLRALREDVERAGGTLAWGLTPAGFRVSATLPLEEVLV